MTKTAVATGCVAESRVLRDTNINLRIPMQTKELIDAAASAVGQTRTEFVVSSAKMHAIDVLLDQRFFSLGAIESGKFFDLLVNPPEPNEKLKNLMKKKAPWQK